MGDINQDIKEAELRKIEQEILNLKSEQERTDKEKEEINKRITTSYFKKNFWQILITALTVGPLIWFYFTNAIQPVLEKNKIQLTNLRDSLDSAVAAYKQDTAEFAKESQELSERISQFDSVNRQLKASLEEIQNNNSGEFKRRLDDQISAVEYNLNFGQLNSYKVGFYFSEENWELAESLQEYLINQGFTGKTQLYPLNKGYLTNHFAPKALEVRYETAYERNSAEKLKNILDQFSDQSTFKLRTVSNRTVGFISIFIPSS